MISTLPALPAHVSIESVDLAALNLIVETYDPRRMDAVLPLVAGDHDAIPIAAHLRDSGVVLPVRRVPIANQDVHRAGSTYPSPWSLTPRI